MASFRDVMPTTVRTGGRSFTWKQVSRSSWPGIAEIVRRSHPEGQLRFLATEAPLPVADTPRGRKRQPMASSQEPSRADLERLNLGELLDETGMPILYISGSNFDHSAGACITFPDQRWLRFPVRGTGLENGIMTAVDQAGNKVARYRVIRKLWNILLNRIEITVHPGQQLTDELVLAIAISAPWLSSYFTVPNQGGGG